MTIRTETFARSMTRRRMFGVLAGAGAVTATGGALLSPMATRAAGGTMTVIEELNLRAEPNESSDILAVLQSGEEVYDQGEMVTNGYRLVSYGKDTVGWALDSGLRPGNANPDDPFTEYRYLAHRDALLETPAMNAPELVSLPFATLIATSEEREGPYRYARYTYADDVWTGWVNNSYVAPAGTEQYAASNPDDATEPVPMLDAPDPSASVIADVPSGDLVLDYDGEVVDGYLQVDWRSTIGWVARDHLGRG